MSNEPFWRRKKLSEMTKSEWESLCDGCGRCCLSKIEDEDTGEIYETNVHCRLYNPKTCQCKSYKTRHKYVKDCLVLTPKKIKTLHWLPKTCAYRLIDEGKDLYSWHPLISKSTQSVHKAGKSTKGTNLISESCVKDLMEHRIEIKL